MRLYTPSTSNIGVNCKLPTNATLCPYNFCIWYPNDVIFKIDMTKSNTIILWTPTFEWYVVECGSKI